MNLYQFHAEPETLLHHDIAPEKVPKLIWEKYENNRAELKKRESVIAKDAEIAYEYATYILNGRFPAGEEAIATNTWYAYAYALCILNGRFPAGEDVIAKDAEHAYLYALTVLKGPFPAGEDTIHKSKFATQYKELIESLK